MPQIFAKVLKSKMFKFLSSVRLAVPLMLLLIAAVAYGTIVESRYNTELAGMEVYRASWFHVLLALLWVNIFCATVSRMPFRVHHTGFVITHIGLLTLLAGSLTTMLWGVDGQLRVVEGRSNAMVSLPETVLEISTAGDDLPRAYTLPRGKSELRHDGLGFVNRHTADRLTVLRYLPFAAAEQVYKSDAALADQVAIGVLLRSNFFNVSEWLHSKDKPELQMGPATLRLVWHNRGATVKPLRARTAEVTRPVAAARTPKKAHDSPAAMIKLLRRVDGEVIGEVPVAALAKGARTFKGITVRLRRTFEQAVVGEGGLREGGGKGENPAIELEVEHQGQKVKEVLFEKYPNFTLNNDGVFGLTLQLNAGERSVAAASAGEVQDAHGVPATAAHERGISAGSGSRQGNTIEFHYFADQPDKVHVELFKNNKSVMSAWAASGEIVQTPWMGMTITLGGITPGGVAAKEVKAIEPILHSELPPSAVYVKPAGAADASAFWLLAGESQRFQARGKTFEVYYGPRVIRLPWEIHLEKFTKTDYPGTDTPMSYESDVRVGDGSEMKKISMNEPLVRDGYTLYQASYELGQGGPPASIFSVNQDPGRSAKYLGSIILVIGIATFTLQRSRWGRRLRMTA